MTTYEQLYTFLKRHYKHSRFEDRNAWGVGWGDYSKSVTRRYLTHLDANGSACITWHESNTGMEVVFDQELNILNLDVTPVQRSSWSSGKGNLSGLF
jgi:hypothetical protein